MVALLCVCTSIALFVVFMMGGDCVVVVLLLWNKVCVEIDKLEKNWILNGLCVCGSIFNLQ